MLRRGATGDAVKITFILPLGAHKVSVVGDFNNWTPGHHTLVRRANGTQSVSVTLPVGCRYHFRYLAEGGHWFDDPDADAYNPSGGIVHT